MSKIGVGLIVETTKRDRSEQLESGSTKTEQAMSSERRDARNRALLEPNRAWLYSYALSAIGDPAAAEDLVQDVMLVAVRDMEKYDGSSPLGAWLRGIARNLIRECWRAKGRTPVFSRDEVTSELDRIAMENEERECDEEHVSRRLEFIKNCMSLLTARIRGLLEMKYLQNLKSAEIALRTQMGVKAIDVALCRARHQVFDCVSKRSREIVS